MTSGYWIEPSIFSAEECDGILASVADATRSRAGVRHLMSNPSVSAIARDERLLAIAKRALGETAIPFRATLFEKTGEKNWLIA